MPLRPRHGYAAGLHRGLRGGDLFPPQEFPAQLLRVRARDPAQIHQVRAGGMT